MRFFESVKNKFYESSFAVQIRHVIRVIFLSISVYVRARLQPSSENEIRVLILEKIVKKLFFFQF